jgi:hypothetical protein
MNDEQFASNVVQWLPHRDGRGDDYIQPRLQQEGETMTTNERGSLVERLRETETVYHPYGKFPPVELPVNRDGPEAADALERCEQILEKCRVRFSEYAALHDKKLKNPELTYFQRQEIIEKVSTNAFMADLCETTLAKLREQDDDKTN